MNFLLSARVLIFNIPILDREKNKFQHKTYSQQFYSVLYKLSIGVMVGIQVIFKHNIDQSLIATPFLFEDIFRSLWNFFVTIVLYFQPSKNGAALSGTKSKCF